MTIQERINKFIQKYPEPYYQPKIWIEHNNRRELYGKDEDYQESGKRYWHSYLSYKTYSKVLFQHYRYDEKLQLCEIAYITISTKVPKVGEIRKWTYLERYFIPKGERNLYNIYGQVGKYVCRRPSYTITVRSSQEFARHFMALRRYNKIFNNEFLKFVDDDIRIKNTCGFTILSDAWQLENWFAYVPKLKTTGKVQQILDRLSATTLEFTSEMQDALDRYFAHTPYTNICTYFDAPNMVLRSFSRHKDGYCENYRAYIDNKNVYVATQNSDGEWVSAGAATTNKFGYAIINPGALNKIPHGEYIVDMQGARPDDIILALKNPEVEQLYNMGAKVIAKRLFNCGAGQSAQKEMFGTPTKKKNFCGKYQVTRNQLLYIDTIDKCNLIAHMKNILGIEAISSIDYNTFVKYCNIFAQLSSYDYSRMNRYNICGKTIVDKIINMSEKNQNAIRVLLDTFTSLNELRPSNRPRVNPLDVKSYEELVRLHDSCTTLLNAQRAEDRRLYNMQAAERRKELEKKAANVNQERQKYNYNEDQFTIRLPQNLAEITDEGAALHHCVGGYVNDHAQGYTTILLLRSNAEPDKSFYTIEVRDDKVVQIHGFGNKWLGNNPEAIPTVMRWLKLHDIACSDQILLSTAKGYCGGNASWVAKPII